MTICSKCNVKLVKEVNWFSTDYNHPRYICRPCKYKQQEAWRKNNPERMRLIIRRANVIQKYGKTEEWYQEEVSKQKGCCVICGFKPKKLFIDHNHITGQVRGLICPLCNTIIGYIETYGPKIKQIFAYLKLT